MPVHYIVISVIVAVILPFMGLLLVGGSFMLNRWANRRLAEQVAVNVEAAWDAQQTRGE